MAFWPCARNASQIDPRPSAVLREAGLAVGLRPISEALVVRAVTSRGEVNRGERPVFTQRQNSKVIKSLCNKTSSPTQETGTQLVRTATSKVSEEPPLVAQPRTRIIVCPFFVRSSQGWRSVLFFNESFAFKSDIGKSRKHPTDVLPFLGLASEVWIFTHISSRAKTPFN